MERRNLHFFCFPKIWTAEFASIQQASIQSLLELQHPNFEIFVTILGDEKGNNDVVNNFSRVNHISDGIMHNKFGTPLVDSIFSVINQHTFPGDIVCYINADIVVSNDLLNTINAFINSFQVCDEGWLLVGKRTNLDNLQHNAHAMSVNQIRQEARERGVDHGWSGIDYFVFSAHTFLFVYPFALGKFVWDQWLVGNVFRRGLTVVDCSSTVLAVHLNAPWYQNRQATNNRQQIHDSIEGKINRSFDHYQKDILTGSTHVSVLCQAGDIIFERKQRRQED